jgi:hypothetical protein
MEDSVPRLVEVYRAANVMEAHAVRLALENAGITALVDGELLPNMTGMLPMAWDTLPRVRVPETQLAAARQIVEQMDAREVPNAVDADDGEDVVRCLSCGEVMGEDDDACPACGWSYEDNE